MSHRMDSLIAERKEQIRVEGVQKGLQKGLQRGKVEMLLNVARKKFGVVPKQLEALLKAAKPEEMTSWAIRLSTATSIEEAMDGNGSLGKGVPA